MEKKNKTVSVLIPMFNSEKYLAQTIESVLNQTVDPTEIIVYDDGSTDDSIKIAMEFEKKEPDGKNIPIRIVKGEKNMGIGFARKRLVEEANTDNVCFISSDDMLLPIYIETMLKEAKNHPDTLLYSNYDVINENNTYIRTFMADTYECYEDWLMSIIFKAHDDTMSVNYNIFAPTKILKENNFDESLRFGEDLEHLLRCAFIKKVKYHHVPKTLFQCRTHLESVTSKKMDDIKANNKRIFDSINLALGRQII